MTSSYRDRIHNTHTFFAPILTMMGASIQHNERDRLDTLHRRFGAHHVKTVSDSPSNATRT